MKIQREQVIQIAKLARLKLSEDEIVFFQKRLSNVLDHMEDLSRLTENAGQDGLAFDGMHLPQNIAAPRADIIGNPRHTGELLRLAPADENGFYVVPCSPWNTI